MKMKSVFFAALLVTVAAMTATGKNEPAMTGMAVVATKGSEVVKVIYRGENSGKVKIAIYDAAKELVFSETKNSTDGFILPLNFSSLPSGEYTVELTDATGTKTETINYQPMATPSNFHVSKLNEGKFLLSIAGTASEDITIKIYDGNTNLVYYSSKNVSGNFAELYSVEDYHGICTFEVSNGKGNTRVFTFQDTVL